MVYHEIESRVKAYTAEQHLILHSLCLIIQDLNLEKSFLILKEFWTLSPSKQVNDQVILDTFTYLFEKRSRRIFSFKNCCEYLSINSDIFRSAIIAAIKREDNDRIKFLLLRWRINNESRSE